MGNFLKIKRLPKHIIAIFTVLLFVMLPTTDISAMALNSQTTLQNGLKVDIKGDVQSVNDLTNPNKVNLNIEAPSTMSDEEFYNMMLKGPIQWSSNSQLQVLSGKIADKEIPRKRDGYVPKGTTFDIRSGLPSFKLTNVATTYAGKQVDMIVRVTNVENPNQGKKPEDAPQVSFKPGSDRAINSYIRNMAGLSYSYQFVDAKTGSPINVLAFPAINDVDANQAYKLNGQLLGYDTDLLTPEGDGVYRAGARNVNGAADFPAGGMLYQYYGSQIEATFRDNPENGSEARWPLNAIFGVNGSLRNGNVTRPSAGQIERVIKYMSGDKEVHKPVKQLVKFAGKDTFKITGDTVRKTSESKPDGEDIWHMVKSPIIDGYIADIANIGQKQVKSDDEDELKVINYYPKATMTVSDSDEKDKKSNTLGKGSEAFKYSVQQKMPRLPEHGTPLTNYSLKVSTDKAVKFSNVKVLNVQGQDVSALFNLAKIDKTSFELSAINPTDAFLYGQNFIITADVASENGKNTDPITALTEVAVNDNIYTTNSVQTLVLQNNGQVQKPKNKPFSDNKSKQPIKKIQNPKAGLPQKKPESNNKAKKTASAENNHKNAKKTSASTNNEDDDPNPEYWYFQFPRSHSFALPLPYLETLPQVANKGKQPTNKVLAHNVAQKKATAKPQQQKAKTKPKPKQKPKTTKSKAPKPNVFEKNTGIKVRDQKVMFGALNKIEKYGKKHGWSKSRIQRTQITLLTPEYRNIKNVSDATKTLPQYVVSGRKKTKSDVEKIDKILGKKKRLDVEQIMRFQGHDDNLQNKKKGKIRNGIPDIQHSLIAGKGYYHGTKRGKNIMVGKHGTKKDLLLVNTLVGDANQGFGYGDYEADVDILRMIKTGKIKKGTSISKALNDYYSKNVITNKQRKKFVNKNISRSKLDKLDKTNGAALVLGMKTVMNGKKGLIKAGAAIFGSGLIASAIIAGKTIRKSNKQVLKERENRKKSLYPRKPKNIKQVGRSVFKKAKKKLKSSFKRTKKKVTRPFKKAKQTAQKVKKKTKHTYKNAKRGIKQTYRKAKQKVKHTYRNVKRKAKQTGRKVKKKFKNSYKNAKRRVKQTARKAKKKLTSPFRKAKRTGRIVKKKIKRTYRNVKRRVTHTFGKFKKRARSIIKRGSKRGRRVGKRWKRNWNKFKKRVKHRTKSTIRRGSKRGRRAGKRWKRNWNKFKKRVKRKRRARKRRKRKRKGKSFRSRLRSWMKNRKRNRRRKKRLKKSRRYRRKRRKKRNRHRRRLRRRYKRKRRRHRRKRRRKHRRRKRHGRRRRRRRRRRGRKRRRRRKRHRRKRRRRRRRRGRKRRRRRKRHRRKRRRRRRRRGRKRRRRRKRHRRKRRRRRRRRGRKRRRKKRRYRRQRRRTKRRYRRKRRRGRRRKRRR